MFEWISLTMSVRMDCSMPYSSRPGIGRAAAGVGMMQAITSADQRRRRGPCSRRQTTKPSPESDRARRWANSCAGIGSPSCSHARPRSPTATRSACGSSARTSSPSGIRAAGVGLLAEWCPHRLTSLYLGRNEENGIRCVYHGWKFDVNGACVEMPNEPEEYDFKHKVRDRGVPDCRAGRRDLGVHGAAGAAPSGAAVRVHAAARDAPGRVKGHRGVQLAPKRSREASIPCTRRSCIANSARARASA